MTIWKFPFEIHDFIGVNMPQGARVIRVENQGQPEQMATLWAIVDPLEITVERFFRVVVTGHHFTPDSVGDYIGSWFSGPFVWHLFEGPNGP